MNKKEKSINSHIDKAIGYSDKAHDELQIALNIALEGKGLSDEEKELLSVGFATGNEMNGIYSSSVCEETIDEAPMAYKSTEEIVELIKPTVDVIDVIKPIYNFKAKL